jgi:DNA invertase Pin-like site-specific DNA recombinase
MRDREGSDMGDLIGYARVSSRGQSLAVQEAALTGAGVAKQHLYSEKVTGTKLDGRVELETLLSRGIRVGDTLVVTRLDRLARSVRDLHNITHVLTEKGVGLRVLEQAIDTTTPEGRAFFTILSAFGEFETDLRKARQREGIDAALAKGDASPFKGRPATIEADSVAKLKAAGLTPTQIAKKLRIARSSVYRYLTDAEAR